MCECCVALNLLDERGNLFSVSLQRSRALNSLLLVSLTNALVNNHYWKTVTKLPLVGLTSIWWTLNMELWLLSAISQYVNSWNYGRNNSLLYASRTSLEHNRGRLLCSYFVSEATWYDESGRLNSCNFFFRFLLWQPANLIVILCWY